MRAQLIASTFVLACTVAASCSRVESQRLKEDREQNGKANKQAAAEKHRGCFDLPSAEQLKHWLRTVPAGLDSRSAAAPSVTCSSSR